MPGIDCASEMVRTRHKVSGGFQKISFDPIALLELVVLADRLQVIEYGGKAPYR